MTKKVLLVFTLIFTVLIATIAVVAASDPPDKAFTQEELAQFDGKKGAKAYVAIDGVVYDVTLIKAWKGGKHKMGLTAGKDLSDKISKAPHGKAVLTKLPKVGTLN